ncbi:MAG: hypothetical protein IH983_00655 [Planctomycetes bacterium]|nr:hypothetical protein [Planctomycetota bacterium]
MPHSLGRPADAWGVRITQRIAPSARRVLPGYPSLTLPDLPPHVHQRHDGRAESGKL